MPMIKVGTWDRHNKRGVFEDAEFSAALDRVHPDAAVHWDRDVAGSLDPELLVDYVWTSVDLVNPGEVLLKNNPGEVLLKNNPGFFRYIVHPEFTGWVRVTAPDEDGKLQLTPEFEHVQRVVYKMHKRESP